MGASVEHSGLVSDEGRKRNHHQAQIMAMTKREGSCIHDFDVRFLDHEVKGIRYENATVVKKASEMRKTKRQMRIQSVQILPESALPPSAPLVVAVHSEG